MAVGSDDSMKIWLNGKVVYTAAICRGASDYQDVVRIDLKKGNNILYPRYAIEKPNVMRGFGVCLLDSQQI